MPSRPDSEPAWAKVNLYLHVIGRRADGYHLLDSLAVFPQMADRLSAEPAPELSLSLTGPFADALVAEPDNLALRAARALAARCGVTSGARMVLEKNLPIASGIGGGSADAAAALRLLCRLWSVEPGPAARAEIAGALGADIAVCLASHPARMGGIGEVLTAAPEMPDCGMVLVNPGHAVATPAVFKARFGDFSDTVVLPEAWADLDALVADLRLTRNDLQPSAIALCPPIADVLAAIAADPECRIARMSGSGATCYGLFADANAAERAATRLSRRQWWVWGGAMRKAGLPDRPITP